MIALLILLIAPADAFFGPFVGRNKEQQRNLDCERMTDDLAASRYPGRIKMPQSRVDDYDRTVVVCSERLLPKLRDAREAAILTNLNATITAIAGRTSPYHAELKGRTWLVESHDPHAAVGAKTSFALKNALMKSGLLVSDRTPSLAVGELGVITRLPPFEAYPAACYRYAKNGSLRDSDALVVLVTLDPRETVLHAGLCVDGTWTWLP